MKRKRVDIVVDAVLHKRKESYCGRDKSTARIAGKPCSGEDGYYKGAGKSKVRVK